MTVTEPAHDALRDALRDTIDVAEAAALLGYTRLTVRRKIREGVIPAVTYQRSYRIRRADIDAYVEARLRAKQPTPVKHDPGPKPRPRAQQPRTRAKKTARARLPKAAP